MIGAARLECGEPAAKAGKLVRRELGNSFGDFFNFHVAQYSTAETWLSAIVSGLSGCGSARSGLAPAALPEVALECPRLMPFTPAEDRRLPGETPLCITANQCGNLSKRGKSDVLGAPTRCRLYPQSRPQRRLRKYRARPRQTRAGRMYESRSDRKSRAALNERRNFPFRTNDASRQRDG